MLGFLVPLLLCFIVLLRPCMQGTVDFVVGSFSVTPERMKEVDFVQVSTTIGSGCTGMHSALLTYTLRVTSLCLGGLAQIL